MTPTYLCTLPCAAPISATASLRSSSRGPPLRGFLATDDFTGELANISVPTLLAWGDRDTHTLRAAQDRLFQVIPGARFIIYEGDGHAFHWEDPTRFAADLVAFLAHAEQQQSPRFLQAANGSSSAV